MTVQPAEEDLRDATLGGFPCRAMAWDSTTAGSFVGREGGSPAAGGIRTWRGIAIISGASIPGLKRQLNRALTYSGKVKYGCEERDVSAEVFVSSAMRRKPARNGQTGHPDVLYIEFTGGGNLL